MSKTDVSLTAVFAKLNKVINRDFSKIVME